MTGIQEPILHKKNKALFVVKKIFFFKPVSNNNVNTAMKEIVFIDRYKKNGE